MKLDKENVIIICIAVALLVVWALVYPNYQRKQAEERARIQRQTALEEAQFAAEKAQNAATPAVTSGTAAPAVAENEPIAEEADFEA